MLVGMSEIEASSWCAGGGGGFGPNGEAGGTGARASGGGGSAVDGGGLAPAERAHDLAERLALTPEQTSALVAELRNALVPGIVSDSHARSAGVERVLVLADALVRRHRG